MGNEGTVETQREVVKHNVHNLSFLGHAVSFFVMPTRLADGLEAKNLSLS